MAEHRAPLPTQPQQHLPMGPVAADAGVFPPQWLSVFGGASVHRQVKPAATRPALAGSLLPDVSPIDMNRAADIIERACDEQLSEATKAAGKKHEACLDLAENNNRPAQQTPGGGFRRGYREEQTEENRQQEEKDKAKCDEAYEEALDRALRTWQLNMKKASDIREAASKKSGGK